MRVLGVDPGINGGLSVIDITDGAAPVLVGCIDIPVIGVGAKERVDVAAIRNFIEKHKPIHALIERAQAMPKQGVSSGFKYGRAVGSIEATIALCLIPVEIIEPSEPI
jgi:crossover junction endodeoxyribonuclease RuvC